MSFLDPILNPLLQLPILWTIIIISLVIALIIVVVYKYTTNQNLMKDLKDEIKEFQKEMKELRDNPEKMMEVQKRAMQTNMKYMKHSMKSTIYTLIPIILIFGWMNAHLAYEPILPESEFGVVLTFENSATGTVELYAPEGISIIGDSALELKSIKKKGLLFSRDIIETKWTLSGVEGDYRGNNALEFKYGDEILYKDVLITKEQKYYDVMKTKKGLFSFKQDFIPTTSMVNMIETKHESKRIIGSLNWIWTYIIFSIVFSTVLRKLFKVY